MLPLFDDPDHPYPGIWEFIVVVFCVSGPGAGHVYGTYSWSTSGGVFPPTGLPGGDIPRFFK
jgi:hypothetical protein